MDRRRSRSPLREKHVIPARTLQTGDFLVALHHAGAPHSFVKLMYYVMVSFQPRPEDLVDSLEVFAGTGNYTKVLV